MKVEIKVPAVGESITEATIAAWNKKDGEFVKRDEPILVLETDKASVDVVAEKDGMLSIKTPAGQVVPIGTVVGSIDTDAKVQETSTSTPAANATMAAKTPPSAPPNHVSVDGINMPLSPAVRRMVGEKHLDPTGIQGSGKGGRLTKQDLISATNAQPAAQKPVEAKAPLKMPQVSITGETKRIPMTTIRRRIAERLVQAQQTAAILTTFNEIDMTNVMDLRTRYKEQFKEKYGVNLGFMGFFTRACIAALREYPAVNAFIDGTDILYNNFYNIGIAVSTDKGLVVPVIRNAENLSLAQIELAVRDYGLKARDGKISIDDLSGGTFTITNGGVFGSLMSTPILNPPQSAILGMHKIEERPVAINKQVVVRPMMYVALSYDHRMIDGREAVSFLVKVKECVENPERLLLEI